MAEAVLERAKDLPLELRLQIYSQIFYLDAGPLLKLHEERLWTKENKLPALGMCRRDRAYISHRLKWQHMTVSDGEIRWPDHVEEALFEGILSLTLSRDLLKAYPGNNRVEQIQARAGGTEIN